MSEPKRVAQIRASAVSEGFDTNPVTSVFFYSKGEAPILIGHVAEENGEWKGTLLVLPERPFSSPDKWFTTSEMRRVYRDCHAMNLQFQNMSKKRARR